MRIIRDDLSTTLYEAHARRTRRAVCLVGKDADHETVLNFVRENFPPPDPGWQRHSTELTISECGTRLTYRSEDREVSH